MLPNVGEVGELKHLKGTPLEYIISSDDPLTDTPISQAQIGSFLLYQVH